MPNSYEDIVRLIQVAENATVTACKTFGSDSIEVSNVTWGRGVWAKPPTEYVSLVLYRSPAKLAQVIAGERRPVREFTPGDLVLRPPGIGVAIEFLNPVDVTVVAIKKELLQKVTLASASRVDEVLERLEVRPFRSPIVSAIVQLLADTEEMQDSQLYYDSLTSALLHEVWRIVEGTVPQSGAAPGMLTTLQLGRLDEMIFDTLVETTSQGLAAALGMSLNAFTAAIKTTSGLTPYQFVLSRRLSFAKDLVQTTWLPLQDIAWRAGFSSQSHMTDVFRTKLGTSPGKLRAAR